MSDIETNIQTTSQSRTGQAKELIGQAGQTLKAEAQSFAHAAQDRVRFEASRGTQAGAKTLGDFANAVRRAGEDLEQHDQSPASRLVRQAADGLESLSRNLADKEPGDLLNAVRDFGRKNPAAFIGGAVLVGLALGRFARASEPVAASPLSDADLTLTEAELYEGPTVASEAGLTAPLTDDLGGLKATDEGDTTTSLRGDDGTSGIGETDAATTPPSGSR
ncbi:hypothetical protein [Phenylobacterium sp.]|uniref:hypothetical protein n=1 Tax=Phenylobacterium sp. TaxID=1871053 RepID=UPI002ED78614